MDRFKVRFEFEGDQYMATVRPRSKEDESFEFFVVYSKVSDTTPLGEIVIENQIGANGDPVWKECYEEVGPISKGIGFARAVGEAIEQSFE